LRQTEEHHTDDRNPSAKRQFTKVPIKGQENGVEPHCQVRNGKIIRSRHVLRDVHNVDPLYPEEAYAGSREVLVRNESVGHS